MMNVFLKFLIIYYTFGWEHRLGLLLCASTSETAGKRNPGCPETAVLALQFNGNGGAEGSAMGNGRFRLVFGGECWQGRVP